MRLSYERAAGCTYLEKTHFLCLGLTKTAGDGPKHEIVDYSFFCLRLQLQPQLPKPPDLAGKDQIDDVHAKWRWRQVFDWNRFEERLGLEKRD